MLAVAPAFAVTVDLGPTIEVGQVPSGYRRVIPIVGGVVDGELTGVVIPGGADWSTVRPDGVTMLWARYELRIFDRCNVSVVNVGRTRSRQGSPEAGASSPAILTVPTFEAPDGELAWLNEGTFLGELHRTGSDQVSILVYRVRAADADGPGAS